MPKITSKAIMLSLAAVVALSIVLITPTRAENGLNANVGPMLTSAQPSTSSNPIPQTIVNEQGQTLEKIPAPSLINQFRNVIKRGMVMYGVKINKPEPNNAGNNGNANGVNAPKPMNPSQDPNKPQTGSSAASGTLEKIPAPQQISLFDKIQKVGTALWGVRKAPKYRVVTAEESACVIAAIEIKDEALKANNNTATTGFNNAITARTTCQKSALANGAEIQKQYLDECVKVFKNVTKQVRTEAKKTHDAAWKTYRDSLKTCVKPVATSTNATSAQVMNLGDIMVEDGGGNITEINSITGDK